MGFFNNMKITNMAYQVAFRGMKQLSTMGVWAPDAREAVEILGDSMATLARDTCSTEKERSCVLTGLRRGLRANGISETATQNISAFITSRIMAGKPSSFSEEIAEVFGTGFDENTGAVGTKERIEAAGKQLCLFVNASLLGIDNEILNRETPKIGACLYFVGAADCLTQYYKLGNKDSLEVKIRVLRYFGLSEQNAHMLLDRIPYLLQELFGQEAITEGGRTLQNWYFEENSIAPMRLSDLVTVWNKTHL